MEQHINLDEIRFAFVGNVVPSRPEYREGNYNDAQNMWQINALNAMAANGFIPSLILSQRLTRTYQHSGIFYSKEHVDTLQNGMEVKLVPFFNYPILRTITVGLAVLYYLLIWGWRKENRHKYKVVCAYNLLEPPGLLTWLATRFIGATAICSVNDINTPGEMIPDTFLHRFSVWLIKRTISLFDGRFAVTDDIARDFAPGRTYLRVPGGVEDSVLDRFEKLRQQVPYEHETFVIVATGSLSHLNGFSEIIDGFLLTTELHYRLYIAGTGVFQCKIEEAVKQDPRIEYLGLLSFEQVLALYEKADCIISMRLTKRFKTNYFFPSKLYEFLASGVPVISTCTGHIGEEYQDIAVLLSEETPEALAEAIEYVANMSFADRQRLGKSAMQYMRKHDTWSVVGKRMTEYILSLIESRS